MKPFLLLCACLLFYISSSAQIMGRQQVDQFPRSAAGTLTNALTWLPQTYNNDINRRYPLIIFLHGSGESGTTVADLAKLYNATPRSLPGRIADGWDPVAVHPRTGIQDSFIVVSPQSASWSYSYTELKHILPAVLAKYRIDTTRIYLTGLSAGGGGVYSTFGSRDSNFIKRFAAMATVNSAGVNASNGYTALQVEAGIRFGTAYGCRMWTIAGEGDYLLTVNVRYHDSTNMPTIPARANKLTVLANTGHNAWGRAYDPVFRPVINYYGNSGTCNNGCAFGGVPVAPAANGSSVRGSGVTQDSLNLYEWLLLSQRTFAPSPNPTAFAGPDISIASPLSFVTLQGTGTAGEGFTISSFQWSRISGPTAFTIENPNASSTVVSNLVPGTYIFRLTVRNSNGVTATDDVQVAVTGTAYASPQIISISQNQTVVLPANSASASVQYTVSGAALKSIEWNKLKTPGQPAKRLGILGSSTSQGAGSSVADSSYTGRLRRHLETYGLTNGIVNLSMSGYSIFRAMPSSYVPTGSQPAPDPALNITAMLNQNVDVVIVNYPSNGYDQFSASEIMMAFQTIYDSCTARGVDCYITTTQPRNDFGPAFRQILQTLRDSIINRFGNRAINFYDPIATPGSNTTKTEYAAPDNIHINDAGHRQLFNKVVQANVFKRFSNSPAVITNANSTTATFTNLTAGEHIFMASVTDTHEQTVNQFTRVTVSATAPANANPTANAGTDQTITLPTNTVTLNGSGTDTDGTIAAYQWTKIAGPAQFNIATPAQAQTSFSNLVQGVYQVELRVTDDKGAFGRDTITITVNAAAPPPSGQNCTGRSYMPAPAGDRGYYNYINLQPGDTLFLDGTKSWSYVYLEGKNGTPQCPIVIMNKNGQAKLTGNNAQLKLFDCTNIKVIGTGTPGVTYGIYVQPYADNILINGAFAVVVSGRSKNIEISNVHVSNAGIGMSIKEDGGCNPIYNYPNWDIDSISLHHNKIVKTWNQGMYIGNTSPDNGPNSYDVRPVNCNGTIIYPRPFRLGNIKVYENDFDSTGRAAIQLSTASTGRSEIYNNRIRNSGIGGDEAQGAGINLGAYSHVWVYNNHIVNTLTFGISSFGASSTNNILKIENNIIDSSGYLKHYYLWESGLSQIDLNTRTVYPNTIPWVYSIGLYTKPTENPVDSTRFRISGNSLGYRRNVNGGIVLSDNQNTFHKSGNFVCNNFATAGGSTNVVIENPQAPVFYSTNCSNIGNTAPFANAGANQTITLPVNSVTLTGNGSDPDGTIAAYQWTKIAGPTQFSIATPTQAQTSFSNLVQGVYQVELRVTDDKGAFGRDTVIITVNAAPPPPNNPPTANAGANQTITLPVNSVTLTGSGTDIDGTITAYQWTKIAGPAQFSIPTPAQAQTGFSNLVQGVYQVELRVTDDKGAFGRDTVIITVNPAPPPPNNPPTANAGVDQTITLPTNAVTLNGSGIDTDGTIATYQWTKIAGPAQFSIATPTQAQTGFSNLVQGVYQVELRVTDDKGAFGRDTVIITVNPAPPPPNNPPTANAGIDQTITLPTNAVTLNGSGIDTDGTIAAYQWTKIAGPTQFNIATPTQAQTSFSNLVQGVYQVELRVTDDKGAFGRDTVFITVNAAPPPPNSAPTANAGADQTITLPTNTVTLNGSGTDTDGTIAAYQWTKIAGPTQFSIATPTQAQTGFSNLVQGVYQVELRVTDDKGAIGRDTVIITVNPAPPPPNNPPTANAGANQTITLPVNSVTLSGSGIDTDGTIAAYQWTKIAGPTQFSIATPTQAQTGFSNLVQGVYQVELRVTDDKGAIGRDTVIITVNPAPPPPNNPPTANAGANQTITLPTNAVTLNGSGIDTDGTIAAYQWTKIAGPTQFSIATPTQAQTGFSNLVQGVYQVELRVTDDKGAFGRDTVIITVNPAPPPPNNPPTANAGVDQTITLPVNSVTLNGSGIDTDGTIAAYQWTKIAGPTQFSIATPTQAQTGFSNLVQGVYQVELRVTDDKGAFGRDTVIITVNAAPPPPNNPPTANAGANQTITLPTNAVTLNGSGIDTDGTIAAYQWTKIAGPTQFSIATPTQAQTGFSNLVQGVYQVELRVTDDKGAFGRDTVIITVNAAPPPPNNPPTANAGVDQTITLPTNAVTLNGSGIDTDGTIAAYQWTKIAGPTQFSIATPTQAQTGFSNLVQGVYQVELRVTDDKGAFGRDTVIITVNPAPPPPNNPPTSNAGVDQTITLPTNAVTLNGSGIDTDGTIAAYQWTKIAGPGQFTITSPTQPETFFSDLVQGIYQMELRVTDDKGATGRDTVVITVNAGVPVVTNIPPVANAGNNQTITLPVNAVMLTGIGTDSDGTVTAYQWTKIAGPAQFILANPTQSQTSFSNLEEGVYQVELRVTDNKGATGRDTITIIVEHGTYLNLYPNPTAKDIIIEFSSKSTTDKTFILITDVNGKVVYQKEQDRVQSNMQIKLDVSWLNSGVYFVRIKTDTNTIQTQKFIKY